MIWKIAKREFLLNLMTFKFAVGTIVCVVLTIVFVPLLVSDYQQRLKDYDEHVAANEAELRKVKVYKNITPTVYRRPSPLSVFREGLEKRLGSSMPIQPESVPEMTIALAEDNPFLSIFPAMDVSLLCEIVVSVLALLLAYDAISGERERGTLKLMVASTVARHTILWGKLVAGLISLTLPVTMAFLIAILILEFAPLVELTGPDWAKIGLIYLGTLVFTSVMYTVGLFFSCLARKSAVSLMLALLFWVLSIIVIPGANAPLAARIQPLELREEVESRIRSVRDDMRKREGPGMSEQLAQFTRGVVSGREDAFQRRYICLIAKSEVEYRRKQQVLQDSFNLRCAEKTWEIEHRYFASLVRQKSLADGLSAISPISLYARVMSSLSDSDLGSFQYFTNMARAYRMQVLDYMRDQTNNFSSLSYFTPCSEEDTVETERRYENKEYRAAWGEWVDAKEAAQPALDLQDLPRFRYEPPVWSSLQRAIPDLGLLTFFGILFLALSLVAFMKYDVRSD